MTPVLWLDPVAACAVTKAITPAVGLGQLVCATCRGRTRFEGDGFVCSDCNGSGLVQPSGPTTMLIATTARDLVNGERFGPWTPDPSDPAQVAWADAQRLAPTVGQTDIFGGEVA